MAKLRRSEKGGNPLNKTGFYSFVEDWNRCKDAKGYKIKRKARFLNPTFDGILLKNAQFTKVETGCDAYGADLARGKTCEKGFILESGIEVCENDIVLHFVIYPLDSQNTKKLKTKTAVFFVNTRISVKFFQKKPK